MHQQKCQTPRPQRKSSACSSSNDRRKQPISVSSLLPKKASKASPKASEPKHPSDAPPVDPSGTCPKESKGWSHNPPRWYRHESVEWEKRFGDSFGKRVKKTKKESDPNKQSNPNIEMVVLWFSLVITSFGAVFGNLLEEFHNVDSQCYLTVACSDKNTSWGNWISALISDSWESLHDCFPTFLLVCFQLNGNKCPPSHPLWWHPPLSKCHCTACRPPQVLGPKGVLAYKATCDVLGFFALKLSWSR